jgi:hypothetical protein
VPEPVSIIAALDSKTTDTGQVRRELEEGTTLSSSSSMTSGGVTFGRATLQPGWKWSTCVKPLVHTESCEAAYLQYHVSGRLHVVMDDGSEQEFGPGDVSYLAPGHDAWVVGNEPAVIVDISGMRDYAKH